jgi:hypothetical protein
MCIGFEAVPGPTTALTIVAAVTREATHGNNSGDEGNRTPNPRLAKAVLCQLSYVPGAP